MKGCPYRGGEDIGREPRLKDNGENVSNFFLSNPIYLVLIGVGIFSSPIAYMIIREQLKMRKVELKLPRLWWFRKRRIKFPRKKKVGK